MQALKVPLRWIIGLISIIWFFAFLNKAIISAFIYLIIGLFILPISHDWIFKKLGIVLNRGLRHIIPFGLFIISIVVIPKSYFQEIEAAGVKRRFAEEQEDKKIVAEKAKLDSTEKAYLDSDEYKEKILNQQKQKDLENEIIDANDYPNKYLIIDFKGWNKGGFETVAIQNFNIKNISKVDFKDIIVEFTYFAESGTELGSNKETVFKQVKAGQTIKIRDFNAGFIPNQASSCRAEIVTATPL